MRRLLLRALAFVAGLTLGAPADALQPGDLVVVDATNRLYQVDPASGQQTPLLPAFPYGVAVDAAGRVLVADTGHATVLRIDPATNEMTIVSQGGSLHFPRDIALEASGQLLMVDEGAHAVLRIDPATGAQTIVSQGGEVSQPRGVAVEASGQILVTEWLADKLLRIDPVSGAQTVLS